MPTGITNRRRSSRRYPTCGYAKVTTPDEPGVVHRLQLPCGFAIGVGPLADGQFKWWRPGRYVWLERYAYGDGGWHFRILWFYVGRVGACKPLIGKRGE